VAGDPGTYTLNFIATGVNSASQPIVITESLESKLAPLDAPVGIVIQQAASNSTQNVTFATQPHIRFVNASGGTVPVNGYIVTAYVTGGTGSLLPTANTSKASVFGFSFFSGLYVDQAGSYTLNFNSTDVGSTSQSLTIFSAARVSLMDKPTNIVISQTATTPSVVGVPFSVQPRLRLVNAQGGTVPVNNFVVTASLSNQADYAGVLLPEQSCTAKSVQGNVFFNSLFVGGDAGAYNLNFNCTDVGSTSQAMIINADQKEKEKAVEHKERATFGPAGIVVAIAATSPSTAGTPFVQQPRIRFVNASGGTVPVTGYVVTAYLTGPPGSTGVLLPALNCIGVSIAGFVFFSGLYVSGDPGQYTLNFNATDVGSASQPIDIVGP